ncbi:hypothetical protein SAMN04244553_0719 [Nocardia amikacinitolerans]|uniref:Uncharacterized protein n=1 Tax=Nocardia amikacinitolerans TaxID=756689 RepID=A0A285KUY2_9NOCA|nr:hypothetical protein [Nocardia amikacinitolerans]SNY76478.1 hypothetical protein SAMN04244553_0719 [Nocardia amikacinitolerans]
MSATRVCVAVTGAAVLVIPALDVAARFLATPGWIFAFVFYLGAPIWLLSFGALIWMSSGMLSRTSAFATAPKAQQWIVAGLLWAYMLGLSIFCWFMSDGGDADDWQSPAGRLLGADGYNSDTPEYLNRAQDIAMPALGAGLVALLAAVIGYAIVAGRQRRRSELRVTE